MTAVEEIVRYENVKSRESETSNQLSRWGACVTWILLETKKDS